MTSKVADSIRRGLEAALAYAEGSADVHRYGVHIPEARTDSAQATAASPAGSAGL
jgi:hypothetical protein